MLEATTFALALATFLFANYLLFAVGGHWFFYSYLGPRIPHRKILEGEASSEQTRREKWRSFQTQLIYLLMGIGLFIAYRHGATKLYLQWDQRGPWYGAFSFFIIHQLHDAYFYWTHRLMHEWKPLRLIHLVHHESSPPTPYSSLSFHPGEAFIHGLFWYLLAFLIPLPVFWMFGFYSFMFYINMWGHTSFEFWHRDLLTHPILRILNTPTHHNLHHKFHRANYGIYYNFWDKLCGTNHPEYEAHYRTVKARSELGKRSRLMRLLKL
jgi:lathosterol oxidase